MNQALINFANAWTYDVCITTNIIVINDMSLKYGGKFDLKGKWDKSKSHEEHQFGINADISKRLVKKGDRALLIKTLCETFIVKSEGNWNGEVPHYHLQLKNAPIEFYDKDESDSRIKRCCVDPIPDECINLQNNGILDPKDDKTSPDCLPDIKK